MTLKKVLTEQIFTLPSDLDPEPDPKHPMTWTVKALASGGTRQLEEALIHGTYVTDRSVRLMQAYLSFGGTTFVYDDGKPLLPSQPTLAEFTKAWDSLPDSIIDWIVEKIEDLNPQYRPFRSEPASDDTEGEEKAS